MKIIKNNGNQLTDTERSQIENALSGVTGKTFSSSMESMENAISRIEGMNIHNFKLYAEDNDIISVLYPLNTIEVEVQNFLEYMNLTVNIEEIDEKTEEILSDELTFVQDAIEDKILEFTPQKDNHAQLKNFINLNKSLFYEMIEDNFDIFSIKEKHISLMENFVLLCDKLLYDYIIIIDQE